MARDSNLYTMQRATSASTDITHTPITSEGPHEDEVTYLPGERELLMFIADKAGLPWRLTPRIEDINYDGPPMRMISDRYYRQAAEMITRRGGYAPIEQGCWMSVTVQRLSMKRFLYRTEEDIYCEIVVYPGSPDSTYVLDHHTNLPITDLPDLE